MRLILMHGNKKKYAGMFLCLMIGFAIGIFISKINDTISVKKIYYKNNKIKTIYTLKNGKKDGLQLYFDKKGELTNAEPFLNGKSHGIVIDFNNGYTTYEGYACFHGKSMQMYNFLQKSKFNGVFKGFYENGNINYELYFDKGTQTLGKDYYKNGNIKEISTFTNGKRNYDSKVYTEDGKLLDLGD